MGFEPTTFSMPLRRAPKLRHGPSIVQSPKCWGSPQKVWAKPEVLGQAPKFWGKSRSSGASGPGGIRTRDLISAIDARSQLRYRPTQGSEDCTWKVKTKSIWLVSEAQKGGKSAPSDFLLFQLSKRTIRRFSYHYSLDGSSESRNVAILSASSPKRSIISSRNLILASTTWISWAWYRAAR